MAIPRESWRPADEVAGDAGAGEAAAGSADAVPPERYCVIGAGPSGLAMAAAFSARGIPYDHFERSQSVGGIWDIDAPGTPLYESAHFISSKTQSAFLDFPMPEAYPDYPSHRQVLDYLTDYATRQGLLSAISFGVEVEKVVPSESFADVTIAGREQRYAGVVCASGVNWEPNVPTIAGEFSGKLTHVVNYRDAAELRDQRVLIVGLGNSGADIACDAAREAKLAVVSVRRGYYLIPKHIFGMPTDVFANEGPHLPLWLEGPLFSLLLRVIVGDVQKLGMPRPDHRLLESHPIMNDQLLHYLRHGRVKIGGDVQRFEGREAVFEDGSRQEFDIVLLATGYTRRIPYLDPKYLDRDVWAAGQFLTCLSRRYHSLFTLGFAELNGALYPHLSRLAELISELALCRRDEPDAARAFFEWARQAEPDLSGGRRLIHSPRHAHYCDDHALKQATQQALVRLRRAAPKLLAQPPRQLALPS